MIKNNCVDPKHGSLAPMVDKLKKIAMFAILLILTNHDIGAISRVLYWGVIICCLGVLFLLAFSQRGGIQINTFAIWMISFLLVCIISWMYSVAQDMSWVVIKGQIVNISLVLCIIWNIRDQDDLYAFIKTVFWVIVCNAIYVILKVDWLAVGADRIGIEYTGEGWNANTIGMISVWGVLFAVYFAKMLRDKRYYLSVLLFLPLIVYSGSRKAWISMLIVMFVFVFISSRKHLLRAFLIAFVVVIMSYYLMMNVEWLYDIGGHRIESLFNGLFGTGETDSSAEKRFNFIALGWEWFKERPFLGYGVNTYGSLLKNSAYRLQTYSHNNYIELLVGVGFVGTSVFYSIYPPILFELWKMVIQEKKSGSERFAQSTLLFSIVVISLIMQYGMVAYTQIFDIILVLIAYMYLKTARGKLGYLGGS